MEEVVFKGEGGAGCYPETHTDLWSETRDIHRVDLDICIRGERTLEISGVRLMPLLR